MIDDESASAKRQPWRRFTARALPVNPAGEVLLLCGFDPARPPTGVPGSAKWTRSLFWFTVGGALEDGETLVDAAARELHEEVGIVVSGAEFSPALETSTVSFSFGPYDITQDQTFFAVRVDDVEVSFANMEDIEKSTTVAHGWWTADSLEAGPHNYAPELPAVMRKAVSAVLS